MRVGRLAEWCVSSLLGRGGGVSLAALCVGLGAPVGAGSSEVPGEPKADVLYRALLGDPVEASVDELLEAPGRFVGRPVTTRGLMRTTREDKGAYEVAGNAGRAILRLEPQVAAILASAGRSWLGKTVEVDGLFYRTYDGPADASYALRAWRVSPLGQPAARAAAAVDAPTVSLEELVYGSGRYDGKRVRVVGSYRGASVGTDLPEFSRKGARDWILKEGYFAIWVAGREPPRSESGGSGSTDLRLEVIGIPTTSDGVVRLAAREVRASLELAPSGGQVRAASDPGIAALPPHVSFVHPAERVGAHGYVILQFSKPLDPARLAGRVRVRYAGERCAATEARPTLDYRDRSRALVITPDPPPPRGCDVFVDLLDGIIDVDGKALRPAETPVRLGSAP